MHFAEKNFFDHKVRNILTNISLSLQSPVRITQSEQTELARQTHILTLLLGFQDLCIAGELQGFEQELDASEVLWLAAAGRGLHELAAAPTEPCSIRADRQHLVTALDLLLRWAEPAGLASGEFDSGKRMWRLKLAGELAPLPPDWHAGIERAGTEPAAFFGLLGSAILTRLGGSTAANGNQLEIVLPGA